MGALTMDEFVQEKAQLENNLSFFANAKDDNPLLVNARKSISAVQQKVDGCKAQLKMLSVLSNTLQKAKEVVEENTVAENE